MYNQIFPTTAETTFVQCLCTADSSLDPPWQEGGSLAQGNSAAVCTSVAGFADTDGATLSRHQKDTYPFQVTDSWVLSRLPFPAFPEPL